MLNRLFKIFSRDIGIDLGTANTLVYVRGRGIIINEPSIVAINKKTDQILSIGAEAKKMIGRTPGHIVAIRPLIEGVISDFEVTEQMLKYFFNKVHKDSYSFLVRPRVVIGIPSGVTEVERRAVEDAAKNAGARDEFQLLLGEKTAEEIKILIGSVSPLKEKLTATVRGRDLISCLPKEILISDAEVCEAIAPSVNEIISEIRSVVEETPPELISDLMTRGIVLAGGGSLLRGFPELVAQTTGIPTKLAEDPLTAVVRGCGIILEDVESLREILVNNG